MKNYLIMGIGDPLSKYPDHKDKEFKSLPEYLDMARKAIMYFAPSYSSHILANSEDAIANVAHQMMIADWRFDKKKGRKPKTFRGEYAKYAIKDIISSQYSKKNQNQSLQAKYDDDGLSTEEILHEDQYFTDPKRKMLDEERLVRIKNRIKFGIKNAHLNETEQKCIEYKFFHTKADGSAMSYREVGKMFDPPISKQAAQQSVVSSLAKIKSVLKSKST